MDIKNKNSHKTILEVSDDEFTLIQYLLEKSAKKNEGVLGDDLSKSMFETMSGYELE
jgi:hypothetical protein